MGFENDTDKSWMTWISWVREALSCLSPDGHFVHLPGSGGFYEQDPFIMAVWQTVRAEYLTLKADSKFMDKLRAKHGKI